MADFIMPIVVIGGLYYLYTTGTLDKIIAPLVGGGGGAPAAGGGAYGGGSTGSTRSYKTSTTGKGGGYSNTKSGKPNCGYNTSNGCCGRASSGGNCPETLNFANLGTNNPCPGYYSDPQGGRHHCCPDKPPFNAGTTCTIS